MAAIQTPFMSFQPQKKLKMSTTSPLPSEHIFDGVRPYKSPYSIMPTHRIEPTHAILKGTVRNRYPLLLITCRNITNT